MKKVVLCILMSCLIFTSGVMATKLLNNYVANEVDYSITIDGEQQTFSLPVVSIEDSTYVALRQLCEKIGYRVDWLEEERRIDLSKKEETNLPYYEDLGEAREGVLHNGTKYNYVPINDFSYKEQIAKWGVTRPVEGNYGEIPTAEIAAEIGGLLLYGWEMDKNLTIQVYFDKLEDTWFVYGVNKNVAHSGLRAVVLQRSDGKIVNKYEIR